LAYRHELEKDSACRSGEFLIKKAADELGFDIIVMSEKYGKELSTVFRLMQFRGL